jgi:hypothetical protein
MMVARDQGVERNDMVVDKSGVGDTEVADELLTLGLA